MRRSHDDAVLHDERDVLEHGDVIERRVRYGDDVGVVVRPKETPKVAVTMRLDPEVAEFFRSSGEGWETRLNALPAAHVKRASKRASSRSPIPAKSGRRVA